MLTVRYQRPAPTPGERLRAWLREQAGLLRGLALWALLMLTLVVLLQWQGGAATKGAMVQWLVAETGQLPPVEPEEAAPSPTEALRIAAARPPP